MYACLTGTHTQGPQSPNVCMSGSAGIFADWDLCQRMWVAGWQVLAAKQVQMEHDKEVGGTHKPETKELCWGKQLFIAREVTKVSFHVPILT